MKKTEPTSEQTQRAYDALAAALADKGAEKSSMFGMPALKRVGKAFAGVFGDAMVFKLDGEAHRQALALAGAELFDPSGMNRPMKAWVVVPRAHLKRWPELGTRAFELMAVAAVARPATKRAVRRKT
jgi:hypothetical protein